MTSISHLNLQPLPPDDVRLSAPVYGIKEAAAYLEVPAATFHTWVRGYARKRIGARPTESAPVIRSYKDGASGPSITFMGLAEGQVLNAFREAGVPLPRIRAALLRLAEDTGIDYALASGHLYTDGREVLFEYAEREGEDVIRSMTEPRTGQRVLRPVIEQYLKRIEWGPDQWPARVILPAFSKAPVIADMKRSFGRPILLHGGARVEDVADRFYGGDDLDAIAEDFGVPIADCIEAIRVVGRYRLGLAA